MARVRPVMPIAVRRRSGDFIRTKPEEMGPRDGGEDIEWRKRVGGQNAAQRDLPEAAQNEALKALNSACAPSGTSDDQKLPIPAAVSDDQQIPLTAPAPSPPRPLSGLAAKQTHDDDELSAPVVAQPSLELSERYDSIQLCTHSKNLNILLYDTCGVHQSWKDKHTVGIKQRHRLDSCGRKKCCHAGHRWHALCSRSMGRPCPRRCACSADVCFLCAIFILNLVHTLLDIYACIHTDSFRVAHPRPRSERNFSLSVLGAR